MELKSIGGTGETAAI